MARLRRNRFLLFGALLVLGAAVGITFALLEPRGLVQARSDSWGPPAARVAGHIEGYRGDLRGGVCGLRRVVEGAVVASRAIVGCHAWEAPRVVEVGGETLVVWEHDDREVAISRVAASLELGDTLLLARPTSARGTLLPRTDVRGDGERLAVWYRGGHVVSVGAGLTQWPGGPVEVALVRLGPRASVILIGMGLLLFLYLAAAGWTLRMPSFLRRCRERGRTLEVVLPWQGSNVVVEGAAVTLELDQAWTFGIGLDALGGQEVTLVLRESLRAPDAYRTRDRVHVSQIWNGDFAEATALARAFRTGTIALAVAAAGVLLLGLDAYLAL